MELRQLRYFVAVAEEGNISRAAKKIFLTQPALSRQVKALEDEIGQCLLERRAHSIRLTPVGEALLRDVVPLCRGGEVESGAGYTGSCNAGRAVREHEHHAQFVATPVDDIEFISNDVDAPIAEPYAEPLAKL